MNQIYGEDIYFIRRNEGQVKQDLLFQSVEFFLTNSLKIFCMSTYMFSPRLFDAIN